jgi:hypothetical protein
MAKFAETGMICDSGFERAVQVTIDAPTFEEIDIQSLLSGRGSLRSRKSR